jgi:hypothetical protein
MIRSDFHPPIDFLRGQNLGFQLDNPVTGEAVKFLHAEAAHDIRRIRNPALRVFPCRFRILEELVKIECLPIKFPRI